ncbi:MFS transporter [Seongchinamella sediminis]|uniref:MFS transporter n=1 Tax=Seongchinamella sediminis TaxID=2283635 RepID=A0A3L7E1P7_9GAMM|nr:MFS transporter [Seongchinamella sediminis]RLQ22072.1 MFS transporter [Seongchinamella sediminis]
MKVLLTVSSLLLSTALLLVGHGMQLTLLPLRASALGMPEWLIGLSASSYFLGFIVGCLGIPPIIGRVGHIRCFAVLAAAMISGLLLLEMIDNWQAWLVLRFITGLAVCGLYAVIESWLTSQSTAETRGRILAIYTFITLAAMTAGQFLINVGPVDSSVPYTLAAVFMALAIIPIGLTRRIIPSPVQQTQSGFSLLFDRSQTAFAGALLSGLVMGSFWSVGALFASDIGQSNDYVTWFMSTAIVGGAMLQYPLGWLSDRMDRRYILVLLCLGAALSSVAVAMGTAQAWFLAAVFVFGAMAMPIYAISLATAADVSSSEEFVSIGTAVLLLHAMGAVVAPVAMGQVMSLFGASSMFWTYAILFLLFALILYALLRVPRAVTVEEQTPFEAVAAEMAPANFELDPRSTDETENPGEPNRENAP